MTTSLRRIDWLLFPTLAVVAFVAVLAGCAASDRSVTATATPAATSPRAAVERFLQFYFHGYGSALPSAAERVALAPMITAEFAAALEGAAKAERCAYQRHRGAEPPLLQGDLFSSLFEKATGVLGVTELRNTGTAAEYALQFEYRMPGAARAETTWSDAVRLRLVEGEWRVDDLVHRGDWDFASKGSVRALLEGVAESCKAPDRDAARSSTGCREAPARLECRV